VNDSPVDGETKAYNPDEIISLYHKIIDIINILCEDKNFGNFNFELSDVHLRLYYSNVQKKDNDAALKHFKLAAKHAILFDAIPQTTDEGTEEYTSLLFRGVKFGIIKNISRESKRQYLLNRIESENYFSHFPSEEIDVIKEDLQKSANSAL